mmetsp:Transcript_54632/g.114180  ORF Transcript_54632/g.114180 Transcript_54632/m.114180 type:complete len:213 (-) Transcript_54632:1225-1863(-)
MSPTCRLASSVTMRRSPPPVMHTMPLELTIHAALPRARAKPGTGAGGSTRQPTTTAPLCRSTRTRHRLTPDSRTSSHTASVGHSTAPTFTTVRFMFSARMSWQHSASRSNTQAALEWSSAPAAAPASACLFAAFKRLAAVWRSKSRAAAAARRARDATCSDSSWASTAAVLDSPELAAAARAASGTTLRAVKFRSAALSPFTGLAAAAPHLS